MLSKKQIGLLSSFILGFLGLFTQVFLFREMIAILRSNELILALLFFFWLVINAIGTVTIAKFLKFYLNLLLLVILVPISFYWIKVLGIWLQVTPGQLWELWRIILLIFLALLPFNLVEGGLFSNICRFAKRNGDSLTYVYIFDALGAIAGGFLSLILVGALSSSLMIVLIASLFSLIIYLLIKWKRKYWFLLSAIALMFFSVWSGKTSRSLESKYWDGYELVTYNSKYGKIQLLQREGERYLFETGTLVASSTDTVSIESIIHTCMLIHSDPQEVMLIGGIMEGALNEISRYSPESITYLELDPMVVKLTREHFPRVEETISQPNVDIHLADARFWCKRTPKRFDMIILLLPNPTAGVMNRFYTREFFEEIKTKLNPGGVLAFKLAVGVNYLSIEEQMMVASILKSLQNTFQHTQLYHLEGNMILMGSQSNQLDFGAHDFQVKLEEKNIATHFFHGDNLYYFLEPYRQTSARTMIESRMDAVSPNIDFSPIAYFFALQEWSNLSNGGNILKMINKLKVFHWLLLCFIIFFLVKIINLYILRRKLGTFVLVIVGGFGGILTELIVLYLFQAVFGYLYWLVGSLTSIHMIGHVVGAALFRKVRTWFSFRKWAMCWIIFVLILLLLFQFTDIYMNLGYFSGIMLFFILQLVAGILTGILFPMGVEWMNQKWPESKNKGGLIYGLDCLGAGLGSILAGLCFIPVFGITGSVIAWLIVVILAFPIFI